MEEQHEVEASVQELWELTEPELAFPVASPVSFLVAVASDLRFAEPALSFADHVYRHLLSYAAVFVWK